MPDAYCKERVPGANSFYRATCSRKAKRDGYCTQHHPDAKAARDATRDAKWKAESVRRTAHWRVRDLEAKVVEAAEAYVTCETIVSDTERKALEAAVEELRSAREALQ